MPIYDLVADFGAVADGVADDGPKVQLAIDACVTAGGGVIDFPDLMLWSSAVSKDCLNARQVKFRGTGGSKVLVDGGAAAALLNLGNVNEFNVEGLVFFGNAGGVDCKYLWDVTAVHSVVRDCAFANLFPNDWLLAFEFNRAVLVENCHFGGSTGPKLLYNYQGSRLAVRETTFVDYYNENGVQYTKTFAPAGSWVHAVGPTPVVPDTNVRAVEIVNCLFDEGADRAIYAQHLDSFELSRSHINHSVSLGSGAVECFDVKGVFLKGGKTGYRTQENIALVAEDCDLVEIKGYQFTEGSKYVELRGDTRRCKIESSPLQGTDLYPNGVKNTAGARVEIDGISYRDGVTQIG